MMMMMMMMFYGYFSYHGVAFLRSVEYMVVDVIEKKMIPDMRPASPDGSGVPQQDLAPCHTPMVVTKLFKDNHIKVLDWPGNSLDLSPIEKLWAVLKACLFGRTV